MTNEELTTAFDVLGLVVSTLAFVWCVNEGNKTAIYSTATVVLLFIRFLI